MGTMNSAAGWVPETRFGTWFLTTALWRERVLPPAIREFVALLNKGRRPRFSRILDVGCGRGLSLPLLDAVFAPDELVGIDIDLDLVARGTQCAARCISAADIRCGDAARLDLPDASVDMVFCHQTMHHLTEQEAAAREFFRVLRPGGVLLFAESCRVFISSLRIRLLFRHPMEVQRSAEEYLALLRGAGFEFEPENVSYPCPFWARSDFGLRELLGWSPSEGHPAPLVYVAAVCPAES